MHHGPWSSDDLRAHPDQLDEPGATRSPQDVGLDILPGQHDCEGDALSAATCALSRRGQIVWS